MQDPLRAFLTGKRSARRHPLQVPVQISGPALWVVGESIDVSTNGVCLRVALADLFDDAETLTEKTWFDLVQIALDEGVKLLFPVPAIVAEATPVRVALDPERAGWLQLGCRLVRNLSVLELSRLGLNPAECGPENPMYGPPSKALPIQMNGGPDVRVSIFAIDDRSKRLFDAKLLALGQQSLAIAIMDEDDPHEVLRRIGCLELYFCATRDGQVVWDSRAMIAALPMISALSGMVEIGLVATTAPTEALGLAHPSVPEEPLEPVKKAVKKAAKKRARKKAAKKRKTSRKKSARKKKAARKKVAKRKSARKQPARRPTTDAAPDAEAATRDPILTPPQPPLLPPAERKPATPVLAVHKPPPKKEPESPAPAAIDWKG